MVKRKTDPAAAPEESPRTAETPEKPRATLTTNEGGLTVIGPAAPETAIAPSLARGPRLNPEGETTKEPDDAQDA